MVMQIWIAPMTLAGSFFNASIAARRPPPAALAETPSAAPAGIWLDADRCWEILTVAWPPMRTGGSFDGETCRPSFLKFPGRNRSRCVTRWMERESREELDTIYVPAFAVAQWVIRNWWFLLYEPSPTELPPGPLASWTMEQSAWLHRHCMRSADAELFLPRLLLWNDGRHVCAAWSPDAEAAYDRMPGHFLYGSFVQLDPSDVEDGLRDFLTTVLRWVEGSSDDRAVDLRENWRAIVESTAKEAAFARAAARMGLDPYAITEWPPGLPELVETALSDDVARPFAKDFLAVAQPTTAAPLWDWVNDLIDAAHLEPAPALNASSLRLDTRERGGQAGVMAARHLRRVLEISDDHSIEIADVVDKAGFGGVKFESHNHRPDNTVKVAVGWRNGSDAVIIGPTPELPEAKRFLEARALFHALFTCDSGPRLVTRGHDWDQQASRGFAAELLAPRTALLRAIAPYSDEEDRPVKVVGLSRKYGVSVELIERQIENAERLGYEATRGY